MHNTRIRRYGDPDVSAKPGGRRAPERRRKPGDLTTHSDGYLIVYLPGHPLAIDDVVYQHRVVLYESIGPGSHVCAICEREVSWGGEGIAKLVVDHIDEDPTNNEPDNLQPTCRPCNAIRGGNWYARRTHCKHGHEYTPDNTRISRSGARLCKTCQRAAHERQSARRKAVPSLA